MIDSHAHVYLCDQDEETILKNAQQQGITHIINIGIDIGSSKKVLAQFNRHEQLIPTAGIHPCEVEKNDPAQLETLIKENPVFKAIGECGLDYYWQDDNKEKQKKIFIAQLNLAKKTNLPVIIHNRKADQDIQTISNQHPSITKVFHCYQGGFDDQTINNPNHFFSFTGQITYAKKGKTVTAIKALPLEKIMIETDSP